MTKTKEKHLNSLRPFINYLLNIGGFRKLGLSLFMLSSGRQPTRITTALAQPGSVYGLIFLPDRQIPLFALKGLIILVFAVSVASMVTGVPYANYFFFSLVFLMAVFSTLLVRAFSIARAGFLVQFRIPENYYLIEGLMNDHWHAMSLSQDPVVRYSAVAFQELSKGEFEPFKLLMILEGLFVHFDIRKEDVLGLKSDDDELEKILLRDQEESGK